MITLGEPEVIGLGELDALSRLARTQPIFHAEADFQHALAWELRAHAERIRLELRPLPDEALFLDLLVHGPLGRSPVARLRAPALRPAGAAPGRLAPHRAGGAGDDGSMTRKRGQERSEAGMVSRFRPPSTAPHGAAR